MSSHNERSKYDMDQALAMKGISKRTLYKQSKSNIKSNTKSTTKLSKRTSKQTSALASTNTINTKQKVNSSLRGLDLADELANKGNLQEARLKYEYYIGELIHVLNDMKTSPSVSTNDHDSNGSNGSNTRLYSSSHEYIMDTFGISPDVLKERTRAALTEAELLKERIKREEQGTSAGKGKSTSANKSASTNKSSNKSSNTSQPRVDVEGEGVEVEGERYMSRLFNFGKSKSTREIQRPKKTHTTTTTNDIIPKSKSADTNISGNTKTKTNTNTNTNTNTVTSSQPTNIKKATKTTKNKPRKKSNLNYKTDDPFITTIKNDMYVDSTTLTTTWNDISGLINAKRALQEAAILPLLRPDLYTGLRSPPKGILLYGPPGTGKTMLVKAVAHESQCILFACSASAMTSKWVGEGEKLIRTLFRMASDVAPSIIFLDEMDSMLGRRKSDGNSEGESSRRFKTEFMVQMDGITAGGGSGGDGDGDNSKRTLLIGATNCPWDIDDAIMRRFQRRVYVPLPDSDARSGLWKNMVSKSKGGIKMSTKDVKELVKMTDGFSCSDIASTANEASFGPLRDLGGIEAIKDVKSADVRPILLKDFKSAILSSKKSVSKELLQRYDQWEESQSSRG